MWIHRALQTFQDLPSGVPIQILSLNMVRSDGMPSQASRHTVLGSGGFQIIAGGFFGSGGFHGSIEEITPRPHVRVFLRLSQQASPKNSPNSPKRYTNLIIVKCNIKIDGQWMVFLGFLNGQSTPAHDDHRIHSPDHFARHRLASNGPSSKARSAMAFDSLSSAFRAESAGMSWSSLVVFISCGRRNASTSKIQIPIILYPNQASLSLHVLQFSSTPNPTALD